MMMPPSRGPVSAWLAATLHRDPAPDIAVTPAPPLAERGMAAWDDDDLQLALWCCYELHYRGFGDVDEGWEWHPAVMALLAALERPWVAALRGLAGESAGVPASRVPSGLRDLTRSAEGPDLAGYMARTATREQFAEFAAHRSVYQLKGWLGLDDSYGYYVPAVPAVTLAVSNLMSLFALHRRWTGALLGHLAALEMTSTEPNRLYAAGARRLGAGPGARWYFEEHVAADAVHEQIAAHDLCGGYAAARPDSAAGILFGAACCLALDGIAAGRLLSSWEAGRSSLQRPAGSRVAA